MISVIIPMYNSEKTIISTLNSVKYQTAFKKIKEIIVINDGSTDNSECIIKDYINENEEMNIMLINQENKGVSAARNKGMKLATGQYIALLDSDDVWLPNKIERQMFYLEKYPYIDFLGCDSNPKGLSILGRKINKLYKANIKDLCIKCFPSTPAAIFKKNIIHKIGYFDENQKYGEDMNYFNKICINFEYYHLPEFLVYIGGGKPNYGHSGLSGNLWEMHKGQLKNIKELRDEKYISNGFYMLMYIFFWIKHYRRNIITYFRNIG